MSEKEKMDIPAEEVNTEPAAEEVTAEEIPETFTVTREQMAAFLYRYAQYKGFDIDEAADLAQFADANRINDFAIAHSVAASCFR